MIRLLIYAIPRFAVITDSVARQFMVQSTVLVRPDLLAHIARLLSTIATRIHVLTALRVLALPAIISATARQIILDLDVKRR